MPCASSALRFGEVPVESFRVDPGLIEAAPSLLDAGVRDALVVAAAQHRPGLPRPGRGPAATGLGRARSRPADRGRRGAGRVGGRLRPRWARCVPVVGADGRDPRAGGRRRSARRRLATRPRPDARRTRCSPPARSPGVEEVYAVGGAQAIAALALGTELDRGRRRDRRAGQPLRHRGQAAARGRVGIDGIAGPSELAVVADGTADPELLALDLCAQAEHGDDSLVVAISPDPALLDRRRRARRGAGRRAAERRRRAARAGHGPGARARADARRRARARAPRARLPGRRRGERARAGRRLRIRRLGRSDRVRRLRGRLQPRAAHRWGGALRRAARAGCFHAAHVGRRTSAPRRQQNWRPTSRRSRPPRASRSTASRRSARVKR